MKSMVKPSEQCLGLIADAFEECVRADGFANPARIWTHFIMLCFNRKLRFDEVFAWDERKAGQTRNRIKLVADCIRDGLVPGLTLDRDAKGREIVKRFA